LSDTYVNSMGNLFSDGLWRSLHIECEPGFEDIISAYIFESGFSGLEEHSGPGNVVYTAYYRRTTETDDPFEKLSGTLDELALSHKKDIARILSLENVPAEDWELSWRRGLSAIEVGSRLVIRPSWVDYENTGGLVEIIIDPKMAFGTGSHATTRLCLETIEKINPEKLSVLDAGCGSGVLSIAAVKLGARHAAGFDIDLDSVENARENVIINGVRDRVVIEHADIFGCEPGRFDLVFANIISGVLIPNLRRFRDFLLPEGKVVFSGLLAEEETLFIEHLKAECFKVREISRMDEWIAVEAET
jgi:ribosomal protein L11 methyltransferase